MRIHQEKPSELEWRLWKRANKLWSYPNGILFQPLGKWTRSHSKERRIQCLAYQYDNILAVRKEGTQYNACPQEDGRDFTDNLHNPLRIIHYKDIPEHAQPVTVILRNATTWRITQVTQTLRPAPPITYGTFEEFIDTLDPWEKDLLQHHDLSPDPFPVSLELQTQFFAGSDGSEKYGDKEVAFGWAISTAFGERMAHGMGPARGTRRMDSYRAECTGLLSILRFLIRLSQYTVTHEMPQGVIGTDSQSLLDKILPNRTRGDQRTFEPVKLDELTSEWDLLIEIQEGMRLLPRVSITHVNGHQDDKHPYDRLPLPAQLNVDADKQVGRYQNQYGTPRPFVLLPVHTIRSTSGT
ncbi:hypothetical protein MHU86_11308 [Fragilaria crotonensis]|nr:hypothetical protein MHU86_11308 [Fragilaria crotonensis]